MSSLWKRLRKALLVCVGCFHVLPMSTARADSVSDVGAAGGYLPSTLPTVVPLRNRRHSLTLAGNVGLWTAPELGVVGGAQLTYYVQFLRALDVGIFFGGGLPMLGTAGVMVRPRFEYGPLAMGLQVEGGFLFAGGLAHVAVDVGRHVWLHTAAGVRYRMNYLGVLVPVGFGVQFPIQPRLDLVVQLEAQIEPSGIDFSRVFATFAFAWRLGQLPTGGHGPPSQRGSKPVAGS